MNRAEAAALARAAAAEKRGSVEERFWRKVDRRGKDECWPWVASVRRKDEGYGAFWLDGRHQPASRVAFLLSGNTIPHGLVVCHRCDTPQCCNPSHLFVGTQKQNNDDKVLKRRHACGERHGMARLTDAQRAEILSHMPAPGIRSKVGVNRQLAKRFGITTQYVSELFWKHRRST